MRQHNINLNQDETIQTLKEQLSNKNLEMIRLQSELVNSNKNNDIKL